MAEAKLTPVAVAKAGTVVADTPAEEDGNYFVNDARTFVLVQNTSAGSINVTATIQKSSINVPGFGTLTETSEVIAVAAGKTVPIQLPPGQFNDSNGYAHLTYSDHELLLVDVYRLADV